MEIDLSQFHAVFFEESFEGLDVMEQELLNLEDDTDLENVNTIFRAAHSIKGGSATFNFSQVAEFTHVMETLLDEMRDGKRDISREIIDLLLKSVDCLRGMLNKLQDGDDVNNDYVELVDYFNQLLSNESSDNTNDSSNSNKENSLEVEGSKASVTNKQCDRETLGFTIKFVPENYILQTGNEPVRMFKELEGLGGLSVKADLSKVPNFEDLDPELCFISWELQLETKDKESDIREVFEWVDDDCLLEVVKLSDKSTEEDSDNKSSDKESKRDAEPEPELTSTLENVTPISETKKLVPIKKEKDPLKSSKKSSSAASIRVGIDKVDTLIDLVGELVITQSMLGELGENFDVSKLEQLVSGLRELESNTRELQESVMRIRMLPIGFVFNRMPRMVRDLSAQLGKNIELDIKGEDTELDKTVMEKIGDPLTHLVRNALDHGIESNQKRADDGKQDEGKVTLNAFHQGGNIIIEIEDNGGGINPEIIYKKAVEKGLIEDGIEIPEAQIIGLIMEPGFSTAEVVSDVSGRGVGLDVVKRNINNLGGSVEISSVVGKGTKFTIRLPLTLAILDGQLIRSADEVYVIPLASIVESIPLSGIKITKIAGNMSVYKNGNEYIPIVDLREEFAIKTEKQTTNDGLIAIVEGENRKIAIKIDELLGQQQVVIKSLESHYKCIQGVSGATILGDGRVSLILDIVGLSRRSSERAAIARDKVA
ncbi:MAG: two-component system chemotaxis sensor kinase CheA [Polaribacter sp.]|jgi:two-component system chemotaxis sensor kinase CheA